MVVLNARAAYFWNGNDLTAALSHMADAKEHVAAADRVQRLHYWTNYSVLAAEAGALELSAEAASQASAILNPRLDIWSSLRLQLAEGTLLAREGNSEKGISVLKSLIANAIASDCRMLAHYGEETLAECYASAGEPGMTKAQWSRAEAARLAIGGRLTPRLLARKRKTLSLT